jgi:hypothetical protein
MKKFVLTSGLLTFIFLIANLFFASTAFGQTITTDLPDYQPGETVIITGTGFQPGETVTLLVEHVGDEPVGTDPQYHQPWDVVADIDGNIQATWNVPIDGDAHGAIFILTADGQTSPFLHAEVFFTDALFTWDGGDLVNDNWNDPDNWSPNSVPASTDDIVIPYNFNVIVTANATCNSIRFFSNSSTSTLTVNSGITLTVTNGISVENDNDSNRTVNITGAGTITVGTNIIVGGTLTSLDADATTTLTSTISTLTVLGNLTIDGEHDNDDENDAFFLQGSGTVNVGGTLTLTSEDDGSGGSGDATLNLNTGAETGTLNLTGATPFSIGGSGNETTDLNGNGATVIYSGANQQVIATPYNNLTISGSGIKTLAGNTTVNSTLNVKAGTTLALGGNTLGTPTSTVLEGGATTGSSITGTGILTLGGNVTVNNVATGTSGATIASPVALGATRTFTVANDGTAATDLSINGIISGVGFGITKLGAGTMQLSTSNTNSYTGTTTINSGILQLGSANRISNSSNIVLGGGTFRTGTITGFSETVGTLNLTAATISTIELGTGDHTINFASSSGLDPWGAGATLTIKGWGGTGGATNTAGGKIFFGAANNTLTAFQLAKITFDGYAGTPILLSTGELVPPLQIPILAITGTTTHGSSCVGTAATTITYTITNTGVIAASGVTVTPSGLGASQFSVTNLSSTTIASGGGTATYDVTFTPSSSGPQNTTIITVASTTAGSNSPTSLLTGFGDAPPTATTLPFPGNTQTICSDKTATVSGATASIGGIILWTHNGFGSISNATTLTPTYTPDPLDEGNTVTLTMTVTSSCPSNPPYDTATYMVDVQDAATVYAGVDQIVCSSSPIVQLGGTIGGSAFRGTWTGGAGTFVQDNSNPYVSATYTPSSAEILAAGTVTLTLTTIDESFGFSSCYASVSDTMDVSIYKAAEADAGLDQEICAGSTVLLAGAISGTDVIPVGWTSSGTGTFTPNNTALNAAYNPSATDIANGTVTLTLTTNEPAGPCTFATNFMVVTIKPVATAIAGPNQSVCANGFITLAGSIGGSATSSTWSAPSGNFSDPLSLASTYTPSIVSGPVVLTLTTNDPVGPCPAVTSTMTVTVDPIPVITSVTANPPAICIGNSSNLSSILPSNASSTIISDGLNNSTTAFTPAGGLYYSGNSSATDLPASSPFASEGTHGRGVTNNGTTGTATLTSIANINTTGYSNIQLSLRLAAFSINSNSNGLDANDNVTVDVSTNGGGAYTNILTVTGNSSAYWAYSTGTGIASTNYPTPATFAPSGGGNRTSDGYSTLVINSLPATAQLRVRVTLVNTSTNERWVVDDFKITGVIPNSFAWSSVPAGFTSPVQNPGSVSPTVTTNYVLSTTGSNGCTNTGNVTVTVNPLPIVTCPTYAPICKETPPFLLTGGSPAGGTYTGTGVNSNTFNPAALGVLVGANTITYTYTDGNGCSNSCTFTIVVDNTPPVAKTKDITISLSAAGSASILASDVNDGSSDNCTIQSMSVSPNTFTCANIGPNTVTLTVTDTNGNVSTKTAIVTVQDLTVPIFLFSSIPVSKTYYLAANSCTALVGWKAPTVTDVCGVASIVSSDATYNDLGITLLEKGVHTITYTATDVNGNSSTASFIITVIDNIAPTITNSPASIAVSCAAGACGSRVTYLQPIVSDNCTGSSLAINNPAFVSGNIFPVGTSTVIYTATDAVGNTATSSFTVTVTDTEKPVFSYCPSNIIVGNGLGNCSAIVTWTAPTATDNCTATGSLVWTNSHSSGATFLVGTTTVTYTATDAANNTATCSFTVTVNDTEKPVFSYCPSNITVSNDLNACSAVVTWTAPSATDNCTLPGSLVWTNSHPSSTFPVGTTTVTYTAKDAANNIATCSFTVTVNDTQNPAFSGCPSNIIKNNDLNACTAVVTWTEPTATDNCTVSGSLVWTKSHLPGATFPVGTTTVTYTAKDAANNTATCSFTVTVNDTQAPVILAQFLDKTCLWPPNHKLVDVYIVNKATDNCSVLTEVACISNEPNVLGDGNTEQDVYTNVGGDPYHLQLRAERSGLNTDIGRIYTITYKVTDVSGNITTKTNTVTVAHNISSPICGKAFPINTSIALGGTFWDVAGNKHTAKWLVDGSSVNGTVSAEPSGSKVGKVTGTYKPTTAGVYKLRMNVTDQKGVTSYTTANGDYEAYFVAYDANGGYTYGAGTFISPAGALAAKPSLTDKVTFGFTSNYIKGATNPKGETEFDFKINDSNYSFGFNALNYDYMVVSGSKAIYKGLGKTTINGVEQSGIAFILTVIDGKNQTYPNGVDKIRMKIYNKTTGAVIYDSQPGASETVDPTIAVYLPKTDGTDIVVMSPTTTAKADITTDATTNTKTDVKTNVVAEELIKVIEPVPFNVIAYPNPTDSQFTITVEGGSTEKVEADVFDMQGRSIKHFESVDNQPIVFGEQLPAGSYIVIVNQGVNRRTLQLIKK